MSARELTYEIDDKDEQDFARFNFNASFGGLLLIFALSEACSILILHMMFSG